MGIHTTDAIVLRRYLYRETSVIVSCLTERYGKLKGLVKGLRAHPNRHRSAMEPMTVNRIVFYDTHTSQIHLISQCELLAPLSQIQQDLDTARCGAFCMDLTDTVVPLNEPQPAVYHLLKDTLERLALQGGDQTSLRVHFIVRLLRLAGFHPQLELCANCQSPVQTEGFWSAAQGGLLCRSCLHEDPRAEAVTPDILQAFASLAEAEHPRTLEEHVLPILRQRLDEFLQWRLDRPLKTMSVPA